MKRFRRSEHHRSGFWLLAPMLVAALVVLGALVAGGSVFAASSTDASVNNYQQCANDKPGSATDPTDCVPQGWINGILNAQNSQYSEDQVTAQRLGLDIPSGGPTTGRTITLKVRLHDFTTLSRSTTLGGRGAR